MSITVSTSALIDILGDALQTASNTVGGVHLATHRAPYKDEPGDVDLLCATSTTKYVLGHTWIPADGRLTAAVWPVESVKTVKAICESLKKKSKEHTVDIDMAMAEPPEDAKTDEHPGWTVTLSETPTLFDSDTEFQFHAHHESKFPINGVHRMLTGATQPIDDYEETPLTMWSAIVLAPLVAVARGRGMPMRFFRSPVRRLQVVQIGDTWLGAAVPTTPVPGDASDEPTIEPVLGSDAELAAALKEMAANGITVSVSNPQGEWGKVISDAADKLNAGAE
ncbi:DNA translocase FtsK [Mycobacterium sp. NPDC050853]|uniref:DNA translocase FtsK n=1 Tax=Mycobacterium sp. NPDC050853 TaxID=3155160 RepID=UPI0033E0D5AF